MKRFASLLLAILISASAMCLSLSADNPVIQTCFTPDPAPVVFGDTLYFYCGEDSSIDTGFYNMTDWRCFSTNDMANWTDHGILMYAESFEWAQPGTAWAAQCIERNGKYYLYTTVTNDGGRCIGVAVSDSPTGPFVDALGKPLCGPDWSYIDPTVMIDDDGQAWLMFGNPTCYYVKLKEDMITLDGEIQKFDMNPTTFGPTSGDRTSAYGEGPWIYKRNNLYYLVYAAFYGSDGSESMAYSTGPSVTGPWTYRGQIMKTHNCFTTHGGVIDYKGHSYFFYHKVGLPSGGTFKRSACIEEFTYNSDGTIPELFPSDNGVAQLQSFNPYNLTEAETINHCDRVRVESIDERLVCSISGGGYIKVAGVNFAGGATSFEGTFAGKAKGTFEIRLDAVDGEKVGEIAFDGGEKDVFGIHACDISGAAGVHDLYFVYNSNIGPKLSFDSWQFTGDAEGAAADTYIAPPTVSSSGKFEPVVLACAIGAIVIVGAFISVMKRKSEE